MSDHNANDNGTILSSGQPPGPQGEAALLLVETLIHVLAEKSLITVAEAVEIIRTAVEVCEETVAEGKRRSPRTALDLLQALHSSLVLDLP